MINIFSMMPYLHALVSLLLLTLLEPSPSLVHHRTQLKMSIMIGLILFTLQHQSSHSKLIHSLNSLTFLLSTCLKVRRGLNWRRGPLLLKMSSLLNLFQLFRIPTLIPHSMSTIELPVLSSQSPATVSQLTLLTQSFSLTHMLLPRKTFQHCSLLFMHILLLHFLLDLLFRSFGIHT